MLHRSILTVVYNVISTKMLNTLLDLLKNETHKDINLKITKRFINNKNILIMNGLLTETFQYKGTVDSLLTLFPSMHDTC